MTKKLSVIIVTYNSADYLNRCLNSVRQALQNIDGEIIIIDNASTDNTLELLAEQKDINLWKNDKNLGFAKAVNQGIKESTGQYILLLNPDTIIYENTLVQAIKYLNQHPEITILGSKTKNKNGSLQPSCGKFPNKIIDLVMDRIPVIRLLNKYLYRRKNFYKKCQKPDWIVGSFFLFRNVLIKKVGFFDERYFMYTEDVDYCYRSRLKGYQVGYCPKVEIIHFDSGKSAERYPDKFINHRQSKLIFYDKFLPKRKLINLKRTLRVEYYFKLLFTDRYYDQYLKQINK